MGDEQQKLKKLANKSGKYSSSATYESLPSMYKGDIKAISNSIKAPAKDPRPSKKDKKSIDKKNSVEETGDISNLYLGDQKQIEERNKQHEEGSIPNMYNQVMKDSEMDSHGNKTEIIKKMKKKYAPAKMGNESHGKSEKELEEIEKTQMAKIVRVTSREVSGLSISRMLAFSGSSAIQDMSDEEFEKMFDNLMAGQDKDDLKDRTDEEQKQNIGGLIAYKKVIFAQMKKVYAKYGKYLTQLNFEDLYKVSDKELLRDYKFTQDSQQLIVDAPEIFKEDDIEDKQFKVLQDYLWNVFSSMNFYFATVIDLDVSDDSVDRLACQSKKSNIKPDKSCIQNFEVWMKAAREKEKEVEDTCSPTMGVMKGFAKKGKRNYLKNAQKRALKKSK